jgi:prepilin-type N-terminal cleavage/methylation domain-containing protein
MAHGRAFWRAEAEGGFSLIEVLVAVTILTVALTALAQLFAVSTRANSSAKATTHATLLAQQKMEQLRSLAWGFDAFGTPLTDSTTDIAVVPESAHGGAGLSPSPSDALRRNTTGYVDYLDGSGTVLGTGTTPPAGTVYVRRWSVVPADPANTVVLQVMVTRHRHRGMAEAPTGGSPFPDEVRLISVKTRKPA